MSCPLLFLNADLKLLSVSRISSSFLEKNSFSFQSLINQTAEADINSKIFQFIISVYRTDLNANLLNHLVFKRLKVLDINGQLNSIQVDLFKSFKELKMLRLRSENIKKLFSRQNEWLEYLNYDVSVNAFDDQENRRNAFFLVLFQIFSNVDYYDYPDKDFCFFKNFPHKRLVLPQLKPVTKSSCSCTELFLIHKFIKFKINFYEFDVQLINDYSLPPNFYDDDINDLRFSICLELDINSMIEKCEFKKRLNNCNLTYGKYNLK